MESCILSKFYIKPQRYDNFDWSGRRCILSKFYIKPQLPTLSYILFYVVSYRNSTSNHNSTQRNALLASVVSYRNSTSNHNSAPVIRSDTLVVSYRNSTSNHNLACFLVFARRVVSYRNSTSNHNASQFATDAGTLYLIEILHQTTTCGRCEECLRRCILSKFYIKPQP